MPYVYCESLEIHAQEWLKIEYKYIAHLTQKLLFHLPFTWIKVEEKTV